MKVTKRKRNFNKFVQLSQKGIFRPVEAARKLGISINTVYNWRSRLRPESATMKQNHP